MIAYPYKSNWVARTNTKSKNNINKTEELKIWLNEISRNEFIEKDKYNFFVEEIITKKQIKDMSSIDHLFEKSKVYKEITKKYSNNIDSVEDTYIRLA